MIAATAAGIFTSGVKVGARCDNMACGGQIVMPVDDFNKEKLGA
jgi:hypothetical protein